MKTADDQAIQPPPPPKSGLVDALTMVVGILGCVAVAVTVSYAVGSGASLALIVLPVAALLGLGLVYLALIRFEFLVLFCLAARASLDAAKLARGTSAMNPATILSVLFVGSAIVWIVAMRRADERPPNTPMRVAIVAWLGAAFFSVCTSQHVSTSAIGFLRLVSAGVMYFVLDRLLTSVAAVKRLMWAVYASAIVPLGLATAAAAAGKPLTDGRRDLQGNVARVSATFDTGNAFSRYLLVMMIMLAALHRWLPKPLRIVAFCVQAMMGVYMVLTYTRSSWLALVLAVLVLGALQSRKLLIGFFVVMLLSLAAAPTIVARFSDLVNGKDTGQVQVSGEGNSLSWRVHQWTTVVGLANANPVTGIGLGVTQEIADTGKQPHNDFVRAYVETGLVGFLAYLGFLIAMVRTARYGMRGSPPGTWGRSMAVGMMALTVAFVFVSFAANVILTVALVWYVMAFAAATAAAPRLLAPVAVAAREQR